MSSRFHADHLLKVLRVARVGVFASVETRRDPPMRSGDLVYNYSKVSQKHKVTRDHARKHPHPRHPQNPQKVTTRPSPAGSPLVMSGSRSSARRSLPLLGQSGPTAEFDALMAAAGFGPGPDAPTPHPEDQQP